MPFAIKIHYSTGNSFGSEMTTDTITGAWTFEQALENLNRIKEHHDMCVELSDYKYMRGGYQLKLKEYSKLPFFVLQEKLANIKDIAKDDYDCVSHTKQSNGTIIDVDTAMHSIVLIANNEEQFQISCFWQGYFERLHRAEIVLSECEIPTAYDF